MNWETAVQRSRLQQGIRTFFHGREYLEVETPLLAPHLIPEPAIDVFSTRFTHPFRGERPLYLIPSPEVYMKELLARGSGSIFQITRSFRNSEQLGALHNPEFTMLEYYTVHKDYRQSMAITEELFRSVLPADTPADLKPPFRIMTMEEALREFAGVELRQCGEPGALAEEVRRLGLVPGDGDSWEVLFNRIFLTLVEPELPADRPLVLTDYPEQIPCLARPGQGPFLERWELYVRGVELANCYSEETDYRRVRDYYRREGASAPAESDPAWCRLYESGFPPCSGVAMGIDRLLMLMAGKRSLEGVILFPFSDKMARTESDSRE